jgi:hypothetical protein
MKNDAQDFAQRLYSRVPAHYRAYDAEQGLPLLALLSVVGQQASVLRQDLDALWDNFFIETCSDWAVSYIGALIGANLLANPVTRSNRLEVRDTIAWRRSKGTPAMLEALAGEVSGWSADFAEFFQSLAWSQNLNHLRLNCVLTPDLRHPYPLSLLGRAADPFSHAADFQPTEDLDQARFCAGSTVLGRPAWETPGRHQIKSLGFFVRRLQMFPLFGASAAAADPGQPIPSSATCFTFDPLHRDVPLFSSASSDVITRAAFRNSPWTFFGSGKDIAVRLNGIPVATGAAPQPASTTTRNAFEFGGNAGALSLDATNGMRLVNVRDFSCGGEHFLISAVWSTDVTSSGTAIGALSTLHARLNDGDAFHAQSGVSGAGQLVITIQTGQSEFGWTIPDAPIGRFPGAVLAIRAANLGAPLLNDAIYVYLPATVVGPSAPVSYFVGDDGSTYISAELDPSNLARASDGAVYPAATSTASSLPINSFPVNRRPGSLAFADVTRLGGLDLLVQAELFTGAYQPQGAITTLGQAASSYPYLEIPGATWPPFTYVPSTAAFTGQLPDSGLLALWLAPQGGDFFPSCELIVTNRSGESVLVYLPELTNVSAAGQRVFVAEDGSTYLTSTEVQKVPASFEGFALARAASGQALPIAGVWPLQFRRPVALNLCDPSRNTLLLPGEFGVDPELGRFALAPLDPAIGQSAFRVDFVEAFPSNVGALNYDRMLDPAAVATRFISATGDAADAGADILENAPVYSNVADAVAAAQDGDIIEILDSATYAFSSTIPIGSATVRNLTLRGASGQRPCLTGFEASGVPLSASFEVASAMDSFVLNGLLISGGPLTVASKVTNLLLAACTFDPRFGVSLIATDEDMNDRANYLLCRCIAGSLQVGIGVAQLTVADSIVDVQNGIAIAGWPPVSSPPAFTSPPASSSPPLLSSPPVFSVASAPAVQLERVTVLGSVYAEVLNASDSILTDLAVAEDLQSGCIRFTRYQLGSTLPRRFQCIPSEDQESSCISAAGCFAPIYNSRRFGRPDYLQLATACPSVLFTASDAGAEIGAFASQLNPIRLQNLRQKLQEFMPVGLTPIIIAEN